MADLWVTAFGFVICLGLVGGVLLYFISGALNTEDATRVDLLDNKRSNKS